MKKFLLAIFICVCGIAFAQQQYNCVKMLACDEACNLTFVYDSNKAPVQISLAGVIITDYSRATSLIKSVLSRKDIYIGLIILPVEPEFPNFSYWGVVFMSLVTEKNNGNVTTLAEYLVYEGVAQYDNTPNQLLVFNPEFRPLISKH